MDQTADRKRWLRIAPILDAALELPHSERRTFLDRACDGDTALARELEELLAEASAPDGFLDTPAIERAAPLILDIERDVERAPANALHGHIVGRYRLLTELGEGGMGVVYLAERIDGQFDQQVAIKLVKQGVFDEEARRRFLQERQILAHLQHPAIARLLDGGVSSDGTPFFVMERVDGRPVTAYCSERMLTTDERLRIFLEICEAVQHAHRNLIVHRDLKPSNILVDDGGRVKLLDFGIAKLLGDSESALAGRAQTVVRALTLDYAAPEQLRGESVSTSADVYALGVLLYELLTGTRPYRTGLAGTELERAILEEEPESPSARVEAGDLRRRLRGDSRSDRAQGASEVPGAPVLVGGGVHKRCAPTSRWIAGGRARGRAVVPGTEVPRAPSRRHGRSRPGSPDAGGGPLRDGVAGTARSARGAQGRGGQGIPQDAALRSRSNVGQGPRAFRPSAAGRRRRTHRDRVARSAGRPVRSGQSRRERVPLARRVQPGLAAPACGPRTP
jgi:tRNA A-37 threonylcarbamoyl transferase component Bud32